MPKINTVILKNIWTFYLCFKDRNRSTGACTDMQEKGRNVG